MRHTVGYCTNVHAGADLDATLRNLQRYATEVKRQVTPAAPLGVGLWLSAAAARQLRAEHGVPELADWLAEAGLVPFTINGFPYGDFHRPIVKYDVYRPTWRERERVEYTLELIDILDGLLPEGRPGTISTLPLEWGTPRPTTDQLAAAAANLHAVASRLARLEQQRGRWIRLCLEPEPGCALQRSEDVVRFFQQHLLATREEAAARRYIGVCHDVCHAAVMFEGQAAALQRYRDAHIAVGKVQISSAVVVPWERIAAPDQAAAMAQLQGLAEERYLHQTTTRSGREAPAGFYDDLPQALAAVPIAPGAGQWRVHFHVPVYLARFGWLETSQAEIAECLQAAAGHPELSNFEVETYAWSVLPPELHRPQLADGIADELRWVGTQLRPFARGLDTLWVPGA